MKNYSAYKNADEKYKKKTFKSISTCYRRSPEHRNWIRNLYNEHFLAPRKMGEIIKLIYEIEHFDCEKKFKYLKTHGYKTLCCGGGCVISKPILKVGTVIPRRRFKNYLTTEYLYKFTRITVDEFIDELLLNPNGIEPKFHDIKVKELGRIIWYTWDDKLDTDNPFYFMNTSYAEEAITALGLGFNNYKNQEIISFVIETNTDRLKRPTICDSGYNEYFLSTKLSDEDHGIIKPLNFGFYAVAGNTYELSSLAENLPEAVCWGNNHTIKDIVECFILNLK